MEGELTDVYSMADAFLLELAGDAQVDEAEAAAPAPAATESAPVVTEAVPATEVVPAGTDAAPVTTKASPTVGSVTPATTVASSAGEASPEATDGLAPASADRKAQLKTPVAAAKADIATPVVVATPIATGHDTLPTAPPGLASAPLPVTTPADATAPAEEEEELEISYPCIHPHTGIWWLQEPFYSEKRRRRDRRFEKLLAKLPNEEADTLKASRTAKRINLVGQLVEHLHNFGIRVKMLADRYRTPLLDLASSKGDKAPLTVEQLDRIFGDLPGVRKCASTVERALQKKMGNASAALVSTGSAFLASAHLFDVFVGYATQMELSQATLAGEMEKSKGLQKFVASVEGGDLAALLRAPIDYVKTTASMLQSMLMVTPTSHDDHADLLIATRLLTRVSVAAQKAVLLGERHKLTADVLGSIAGLKETPVNEDSSLLHQSEALALDAVVDGVETEHKSVNVFLFDNVVVVAVPNKDKTLKYRVAYFMPLSNASVIDRTDERFTVSRRGTLFKFTAPNEETKKEWVDVLLQAVPARIVEAQSPVAMVGGRRQDVTKVSQILEKWARAMHNGSRLPPQLPDLNSLTTVEEGNVMISIGQTGFGMRTLFDETVRLVSAYGLHPISCDTNLGMQSSSVSMLKEPVAKLLGVSTYGMQREKVRVAYENLMYHAGETEQSAADKLPLLNTFLNLEFPESTQTAALAANARLDQCMHLLGKLLLGSACRGSPVVLMIKNAQWMPEAMWTRLEELAARHCTPRGGECPRVAMIVGTRPCEYLSSDSHDFPRIARRHIVELAPLPARATREMVNELLDIDVLPHEVFEMLLQKSKGVPMIISELCDMFKSDGALEIVTGAAVLPDVAALERYEVAESIEFVTKRRLSSLSKRQQSVLKVAAVAGNVIVAEVIFSAAQGAREEIENDVNALVSEGIMRDLPVAGAPRQLQFNMDLTRDIVYKGLTEDERKGIHSAVAQWCETEHKEGRPVVNNAFLGHHFMSAGLPAKAFRYNVFAAQDAAFRHDNHVAYELFESSLNSLKILRGQSIKKEEYAYKRAFILGMFAKVQFVSGRTRACYKGLAEALQLLGDEAVSHSMAVDKDKAILGKHNFKTLGKRQPAQEICLIPLGMDADGSDEQAKLRLRVELQRELARYFFYEGYRKLAVVQALRTLDLCEDLGACPALAFTYGIVAYGMATMSNNKLALHFNITAAACAELFATDQSEKCAVELLAGATNLSMGHPQKALEIATQIRRASSATSDKRRALEALALETSCNLVLGDFISAIRLGEMMFKLTKTGDKQSELFASRNLGVALNEHNGAGAALAVLNQTLGSLPKNRSPMYDLSLKGVLAQTHWRLNHEAAALECAEAVVAMLPDVDFVQLGPEAAILPMCCLVEALLGIYESCLGRDAKDKAYDEHIKLLCKDALAALESVSKAFPLCLARTLIFQGWHLLIRGKAAKSKTAVEKGRLKGADKSTGPRESMALDEGLGLFVSYKTLVQGKNKTDCGPALDAALLYFKNNKAEYWACACLRIQSADSLNTVVFDSEFQSDIRRGSMPTLADG